jgi:hypothetical protein
VTTGGTPLALEKGNQLDFYIPDDWNSPRVYVYLENPGGDTRIAISPLQTEDNKKPKPVERISIPANWAGWQEIDITAEELAPGFNLSAPKVSNAIVLRGIRSDPDSSLNWPWDQGLTLISQPSGKDASATEIHFNTSNLVPYSNWSMTVIDDQGDTVLIKVNR